VSAIDPNTSLAELALEDPAVGETFDRLGLDYCCNGARTLADACAERGLDVATAVAFLEASAPSREVHDFDARRASTAELCDHIVEAHHDRLRTELPQLAETVATVLRVHGGDDPRLATLAQVFGQLEQDVLAHVDEEERELFPACRSLAGGETLADREKLLAELEHDHDEVGEGLGRLRELADGYDAAHARCGTHRALLSGLQELERDLHRHIHEENNVLFPRVRELASTQGVA
jgi:regulator of cell morphogenesis and NO signaling